MSVIDELSEYITLRMSSYLEQTHDSNWTERKSHSDYDLWFITAGSVQITINGIEHMANPGDVVFLSGYALYGFHDRRVLPIRLHAL
ncbi:AraC family ligand binding domain-containing protein [Paenibacillus amylolyticus]|nr:AraC family ligand binding domain-containing protein [Paenibacillus amylolyticus]